MKGGTCLIFLLKGYRVSESLPEPRIAVSGNMHIMHTRTLSLSAPTQNLQRLVIIRSLLILGLCGTFATAYWGMQLMLPYQTLLLLLAGLTAINAVTWLRIHKPWPVTEWEFLSQLVVDIASIWLLLYFAGGASNPFVSYFLVPLSIAAATLPWTLTAITALLALGAYTLLLYYHVPLPDLAPPDSHQHHSAQSGFNLHILGMWFNFLVSAALITYFVSQMAAAIREQQRQLAEHREDELRDEQLMAVATLAAGTAHELGTPLSTMKVLLKEMQDDYGQGTEIDTPANSATVTNLQSDLALLQQQLSHCTETLKQLVHKAEQTKDGAIEAIDIRQFCEALLERWQIMRPEVKPAIHFAAECPELQVRLHPTVNQSIINLLNNAGDANPNDIEIDIRWSREWLSWDIKDRGPGIPMEMADQLGKTFITTKGKGLGLGLFLTHATLARYGGTVKLYNREEGGTLTELRLNLKESN